MLQIGGQLHASDQKDVSIAALLGGGAQRNLEFMLKLVLHEAALSKVQQENAACLRDQVVESVLASLSVEPLDAAILRNAVVRADRVALFERDPAILYRNIAM